ncbi:MAG TPA: metalloregulator ArsR/SmtB family transcription factor [Candidatus Nanoarchaeia archaeon]|nr:metalloregulator ArsR/SmtB family transcription factor [Candidatus Nanoarchaeia archaeon]
MICNTYVEFFKTISDNTRVEILFLLLDGKLCVKDICRKLRREQTSISHNLSMLKKRGFVTSTREGKRKLYELTGEAKKLLLLMDDHIQKYFHEACRCKETARGVKK